MTHSPRLLYEGTRGDPGVRGLAAAEAKIFAALRSRDGSMRECFRRHPGSVPEPGCLAERLSDLRP
jgi:hypothetical protein